MIHEHLVDNAWVYLMLFHPAAHRYEPFISLVLLEFIDIALLCIAMTFTTNYLPTTYWLAGHC